MPKAEVKVRARPGGRHGPEVVMEIMLTPRGSGNKKLAQQLAQGFRLHPKLKPHIRSVRAGSSKVIVHLIPSLAMMKVIAEWQKEPHIEDVEGQIPLFGGAVA